MELQEATARCWAEIDLDALCANYRQAVSLAGGAQVICVLKGNAYGLGAALVCRALLECGARIFAVASGDEAESLMDACPGAQVLVLGLTGEAQACRLIRRGALLTLFSAEQGGMLRRAASAAGRPARVHVKLDTGLHRLGFSGPETADAVRALFGDPLLVPEGLYTHLALHDEASDRRQLARFDAVAGELARSGVRIPMRHALDSIGMVRYPEAHMDAVRTGAWLYGVTPRRCPFPERCLPTARLYARVAQIHDVAAGECVGYDDTHPLARDSRVATLTAGYLDGYPRLNSLGAVLLRGRRAPVVGLVCMDQMMVDVTDIPGAAAGDPATLLGDGITIDEMAEWGRLNRNEVLGRFGRRVTRVYTRHGRQFFENELQR